jgi:hypothetical protein
VAAIWGRLSIAAIAFLCTSVFFINFCDLVYRCGCRSLWNGAAQHCNIHQPHARHCPWCNHGEAGYGAIFAAILVPQFAVAWWLRRPRWVVRLALTAAVFPVWGFVVAAAVALWDGYW